jgi:hypothetical protein
MAVVLAASAAAAAVAMFVVSRATIAVVEARGLLPRWDLASHLAHGWVDYHLLTTGRLHLFFWDLWEQGYWPPGLSVFQLPFFVLLGGDVMDGLWASVAAFGIMAVLGAATLAREDADRNPIAAAVFVALLLSSPYLLAYASVTMTEMLGAFSQVVVLAAYASHLRARDRATANRLALALTAIFFVKYNYFFLLAVPLALHFWLHRTGEGRWQGIRRPAAVVWSSWTARLVMLYGVALLLVTVTGGFETRILGQRLSVRSVGSSGHIVLYALLARLWYLHRRGRIPWNHLFASDPLVRPLLIWFVIPVTIWIASPVPNHLRDIANLVINRPMGQASVEQGFGAYLEALRTTYFYADWVLLLVLAAFAAAAWRYRHQPALVQVLIIAVPLQFAAITMHHTRFTRFLLLTVVLLCLAAAAEIGRWFAALSRPRVLAAAVSTVILAAGMYAARVVVTEDRFTVLAFEHYTASPPLREALREIRSVLRADDRLVIAGQSNELSPALFRLALGPPSGVACFPYEIGGKDRLDVASATRLLVLEPMGAGAPVDLTGAHEGRLQEIRTAIGNGSLVPEREFPLADLRVKLMLYRRFTPPVQLVTCS